MRLLFILSHVVAAIVGWLLAGGDGKISTAVVRMEDRGVTPSERRSGESGRELVGQARRVTESDQFKMVWDSLPDQRLSTTDRIKAQRKILEEWALVDLEAAMKAMLAESWWAGPAPKFANAQLEGPFATAFAKAFLLDPETSWNLITSGELGVGAAMLRNAWYQTMQSKPLILAGKLAEIPSSEVADVINKLDAADLSDPGVRDGVVEILKNVPMSKLSTRVVMRFLPELTLAEATANFRATKDFSTREGEITLYQYGQAQFFDEKLEWVRSYDEGKLAEMKEVADLLPHDTQGKFLYGLLAGGFQYETAAGKSERTAALLNLLVEREHWGELEKSMDLTVIVQGYGLSPEMRVEWAVNLPEREEVSEVFEDSIRPYLRENYNQAWDWIQEFPEGRWREHALGQYANEALEGHRNLGEARKAIDQIQDPKVREEAEEKYALYENAGR